MNAKKKIPKKKSQADTVAKLAKRRDDFLNSIKNKMIKPFMVEQSSHFAETVKAVFPYMEKQQKRILGLEEELAKAQTTSGEQSIQL
jgi:hypothetical protein